MNHLVRKVLKEVNSCLLITEPNIIKRCRRSKRGTTMYQVFRRNGFLRCHDKETKRERERRKTENIAEDKAQGKIKTTCNA